LYVLEISMLQLNNYIIIYYIGGWVGGSETARSPNREIGFVSFVRARAWSGNGLYVRWEYHGPGGPRALPPSPQSSYPTLVGLIGI